MAKATFFSKMAKAQIEGQSTDEVIEDLREFAENTLEAQISVLKSKLPKLRNETKNAEKAYDKALIPTSSTQDGNAFVEQITIAYKNLESAKSKTEKTETTIKLLEDVLKKYKEEV